MATLYATLHGVLSIGLRPKGPHVEIASGYRAGILSGAMQRLAQMSEDGRAWLVPGVADTTSMDGAYHQLEAFRRRFLRDLHDACEQRRRG